MNKAFFIDRDGVVNNDEGHYYIYRPEDFVFNPDIKKALKLIKKEGYLLIMITNQGGVAKKMYTIADVMNVHAYMQEQLAQKKARFNAIYFCPHHSDVSSCECRKPKPGMILQAIKELNIDPKTSYLIGDSERDIEAGKSAGIDNCYLVPKNTSILELVQDILNLK